jgi:8-oxo-dGTP pyrophosphatase MutT (NUDIX family)
MVRRHDKVAFMAGAYVFPGGRVDEGDSVAADQSTAANTSRFRDLDGVQERAYRRAAARELFEEARVSVRPEDLVPFAHWVTPESEPRRYDTRFFVARMPAGQEPRHDEQETTALAWFTPADAIDRCRRREIMLPPPTWTTLKWLERFASIDAAFAAAERQTIVRVQPNLVRSGEQMVLTLPGDPTHPGIDGWDVPEDTRFVLEEGQWRPTRG